MSQRRVALLIVLGVLASSSALGADRQPRAVIELFTSQGCSSCPAADKLLGELAGDSSLVTMSLPIDYWDYLGWKDTLAKPQHSARQHSYAQLRGDRAVYTPQIVVNGVTHVLGSDKAAIERAIQQTRSQPDTMALPVTLALNEDRLVVTLPAASGAHAAGEIWLCSIAKRVPVVIGRGENHGRTISYNNVVRRWVKLGDWTGAAQSRTISASEFRSEGADSVAVFVQTGSSGKPGKMIGAALAAMR